MNFLCTKLIFIMRCSSIVLGLMFFFSGMLLANRSDGQNIRIDKVLLSPKTTILKAALKEIEEKTNYRFAYQSDMINSAGLVKVPANTRSVAETLTALLDPIELTYRQSGHYIYIEHKPKPKIVQQLQLKGRVLDEQGLPLPSVSVLKNGTSQGTVTDENGQFVINTVKGDRITFTYIGYKAQTIVVTDTTNSLSVQLELAEGSDLDEVVVVGYGTQRRSDVTGAISSVNEEALKQIPAGNIATALQGTAPGMSIQKPGGSSHPGATPTIRIRGERSLGAGNDPLVIVDGIPYNGSLNDISQDDIVSAQVLKDASSTAIYGSRGANGVILINTRRGRANGEPTLSYNGYAGFNRILGQFDLMDAEQFALLKKWAKWNGSSANTYTGLDDPDLLKDAFGDPEEFEAYQNGGNNNWQDLIYKDGLMTNHQVGINGGTEKTKYDASLGYFKSDGIYDRQGMNRYSLKLSIDQQIGKYVTLGINSLNSYTILTGMDLNPMDQALRASPFIGPDRPDGTPYDFLPGAGRNVWNPMADFEEGALLDKTTRLSTFTSGYLQVDLPAGFKYKFNAGIQINPETIGRFYASGTTKQLGTPNYGYNGKKTGYDYTIEHLLTWDRVLAEKHHFNFTGLYSIQEAQNEWNHVHYRNVLADYVQYHNPEFASDLTSDGSYEKWAILSYMGRLNYSFDDRYLLTFTMRSDGASRLAPGNQWHLFPSVALGWNMMNEAFLKGNNWMNTLKLRASYGTVGNQGIGAYDTLGQLDLRRYNFGSDNVLGTYPIRAANATLGWENTSSLNFGLDYGVLDNRISGSIEFYKQFTDHILLDQTLPATSGIPLPVRNNIGKTENTGVELNISSVNLKGGENGGFSWSTDLNIFLNRGKITELASGVTQDISNSWFVGHPIGTFFNYKRVGIWQNTPEDIAQAEELGLTVTGTNSVIGTVRVADANGDGRINLDDRVILGSRQPKFEGGFTNRFAYKNFDLSIVTYFKVGGLMKSGIHGGWMNTLQGIYNNLDLPYWTPDNMENYWPKPNSALQNPEFKSTLDLMDASYLKIRNINLGYTLPKAALANLGVKSAHVYTTVSNPFVFFSEYKNKFGGLDPETNNAIDINTPPLWSLLFGVNVTF